MKKLFKKLWQLKDMHPYDFFCHLLLGLVVFLLNRIFFAEFIAIVAACNFIIAVELTQFDTWEFNKDLWKQCSVIDYILDLAFGGVGIYFGSLVC